MSQPWLSADFLLSFVSFFRKDKRRLPAILESILSWVVALLLAIFLGFRYLISTTGGRPIPLTTISRNEADKDALAKLKKILESIRRKKEDNTSIDFSNEELLQLMRGSLEARRLATFVMTNNREYSVDDQLFRNQLIEIWPQLLQLPTIDDKPYAFEISVVVPAYREQGSHIQSNLRRMWESCQEPSKVQVVLVDAGQNTEMEKVFDIPGSRWGDIKRISYSEGGGRGPTLNFGAMHADGKILTFLHSDNLLPQDWDVSVKSLLLRETKTIACAFDFQIHDEGTVPGLAAAQWLGTVRTRWFHTIYGDSVISIPASAFRYIGGYPQIALMEDYEMMDLLRKRVAALEGETLGIHPSPTLVSARRWENYGVPYVILFNFLCVYLYESRGWSPQELYNFYYHRPSG